VESILIVPPFLAEVSANRMKQEKRLAIHQHSVHLLVAVSSIVQKTALAFSQVK
jgi:hypothetical protein